LLDFPEPGKKKKKKKKKRMDLSEVDEKNDSSRRKKARRMQEKRGQVLRGFSERRKEELVKVSKKNSSLTDITTESVADITHGRTSDTTFSAGNRKKKDGRRRLWDPQTWVMSEKRTPPLCLKERCRKLAFPIESL